MDVKCNDGPPTHPSTTAPPVQVWTGRYFINGIWVETTQGRTFSFGTLSCDTAELEFKHTADSIDRVLTLSIWWVNWAWGICVSRPSGGHMFSWISASAVLANLPVGYQDGWVRSKVNQLPAGVGGWSSRRAYGCVHMKCAWMGGCTDGRVAGLAHCPSHDKFPYITTWTTMSRQHGSALTALPGEACRSHTQAACACCHHLAQGQLRSRCCGHTCSSHWPGRHQVDDQLWWRT